MKNTKTKRMLAVAALLAVGLALMLYYAAHKQATMWTSCTPMSWQTIPAVLRAGGRLYGQLARRQLLQRCPDAGPPV